MTRDLQSPLSFLLAFQTNLIKKAKNKSEHSLCHASSFVCVTSFWWQNKLLLNVEEPTFYHSFLSVRPIDKEAIVHCIDTGESLGLNWRSFGGQSLYKPSICNKSHGCRIASWTKSVQYARLAWRICDSCTLQWVNNANTAFYGNTVLR